MIALMPTEVAMNRTIAGFWFALIGSMLAASSHAGLPPFLPSFYEDALKVDGWPLRLDSQGEKDGVRHAWFVSADGGVGVAVEQVPCERQHCDALFDQNLRQHNERMASQGGEFRSVSTAEYVAAWSADGKSYLVVFAKVPKSVVAWVRVAKEGRKVADDPWIAGIRSVMNRQRYEEAVPLGNVDFGRWARDSHRYAQDLLARGKADEAGAVLGQVITWAPFLYEAHLDFAETTRNLTAARASALAVWDNAESPALIARAVRFLGNTEPQLSAVPVLEPGLSGLQVVLVPLPPCDLRLLEEAGRLYSANLQVPVRIARLPGDWTWGAPDRVFRERDLQGTILKAAGRPVDFAGWTKDRYAKELEAAAAKDEPLSRHQIRSFLADFSDKPGQYRAKPHVDRLIDLVAPFRTDRRTMVVGVTAADIYGGDANYLFSGAAAKNGAWAGILSYARMQASMLGEPYESRKRLAERLAKELVPASLKQLEIPRAVDPTDPYSYSEGAERLAQKTLTLSTPTRDALDRFRSP
jgi:hypothetical protein